MIGQTRHVARSRNEGSLPSRLNRTRDYAANGHAAAAPSDHRRSGPREHGRQAARSKRSRTGRAGEETTQLSHAAPAQPAP
jgi:hypothetical protein